MRDAGAIAVVLVLAVAGGALFLTGPRDTWRADEILVNHPAPTRGMVFAVQRRLAARGYDAGPVDGIAGPTTEAAISAFEAASGQPRSGAYPEAILAIEQIAP